MPTSSAQQNMYNKAQPFRVGGSGFTSFWWNGQAIGFAQMVSHQAPQPVAAPVAIQPLDQQYPMSIITPAAIGAGTLQVQLFEMYGTKVWDQIMYITDNSNSAQGSGSFGSAGEKPQYNDLAEIFLRLAALNVGVTASKIVYPPNTGVRGGPKVRHYADLYHNIVITDVRDDEQIEIGTMEVLKNMTLMYTHMTRQKETA
jgi:hypothetical protein